MTRQPPDPLVELSTQGADLLGVAGNPLLLPAIRHRPEQRDEGQRAGRNHPLDDTKLDQPRVVLQCRAEIALTRQEHEDELRRRLKLRPVAAAPQLDHVGLHLAGMLLQPRQPLVVSGRLDRLPVGDIRHLRVHDDASPARQIDHHVRHQPALGGLRGRLLREVTVVEHAGQLDHPSQLYLPPSAPDMRGLEGAFEVGGRRGQREQLLVQPRVGARAFLLHLLELGVHLAQRVVERFDQAVDRSLAVVEIDHRLFLELAQRRLRQLQKRLVVGPQRLGRHRGKRLAQGLLRLLEQSEPVVRRPALTVELGRRSHQPLGQLVRPLAGRRPGHARGCRSRRRVGRPAWRSRRRGRTPPPPPPGARRRPRRPDPPASRQRRPGPDPGQSPRALRRCPRSSSPSLFVQPRYTGGVSECHNVPHAAMSPLGS